MSFLYTHLFVRTRLPRTLCRSIKMNKQLKNDAKLIVDFIAQRVQDYPVYINNGPGNDEDPISQITLGYQVSQAGWIALVFDTRPDGSPDGEWQSYITENWLELTHWADSIDAELVGGMLKDILIQSRGNKMFSSLPIAENCSMGVEDHDGMYGWPSYNERYNDGRVV